MPYLAKIATVTFSGRC